MPLYTERPYVRPAYEPGNMRLGDLMRAQGRTLAEHAYQQGNMSAALWANVANNIGQTVGSYIEQSRNEPLRKMQLENEQFKNQAIRQEARGKILSEAIQGQALEQDPETGVWTYNRNYLTEAFKRAGIADRLPGVLEGLDAFDKSARDLIQVKQKGLAGLALGVLRTGATPEALGEALKLAIQNGFTTRPEAGRILSQLNGDPAQIKSLLTRIASTHFADKLGPDLMNVPAGGAVIDKNNPGAGVLYQAPPRQSTAQPPNPTEASLAAAAAAGDPKAIKALELLRKQDRPPQPQYMWARKPDGTVGLMTTDEIRATGADQPPTADMRNKEAGKAVAAKAVKAVKDLGADIFKYVGPTQRADAIKRGALAVFGEDPRFRTYQDSRLALAGTLAVEQQGSRVSDADVKALWLPMVPDAYSDTKESYELKWDLIDTMRGVEAPAAPAAPKAGTVTVTAPDGNTYTFPNQIQADQFKRRAGIK